MNQPVIEILNLTKIYRGGHTPAVSNLSLTVPRGEIFGFLGANGAGKTTTIKILLGLQFATAGEVRVLGGDPASRGVRRQVGYLPERPYLQDTMGFDEFLNFHRDLFGRPLKDEKFLSNADLAALVGLTNFGRKSLKQFSKGMLQRAAIAQALINDPRLLILDEPMSGLDPVGRREVRDLILRLRDRGKTIFLSSHILSDIEQISQRIAFLEKGILKREGLVQELIKQEDSAFELIFAGENLLSIFPESRAEPGNRARITCANAGDARRLIERGWAAGAVLINCGQRHQNLEDVLFGSEAK
ncbi:MAG: ABC transporter ATP-binding protein [Proteobacteria bacterium]|nr:MAG: ABC transporter ATP-binding protein [Pseudomonadota bacterium]